MRRFTFDSNAGNSGHIPFWKPWGPLGCLGRTLAFLALMFLLFTGLSAIRSCGGDKPPVIPDDILHPRDKSDKYDKLRGDSARSTTPVDTVPERPFKKDIPDPGPDLPDSTHNFIPPVEPGDTVVDRDTGRKLAGDRLNIILNSKSDDSTFKQWAKEFKTHYPGDEYSVVYYNPLTKTMQVKVPSEERAKIKEALPKQISDISFKVFDESFYGTSTVPDDPAFKVKDLNWYFEPIQAYEAWDITTGNSDVRVAIIDSYFDLEHPEFEGKVKSPYNILRKNADLRPPSSMTKADARFYHGSMVASQAVGIQGNGVGASGIAPGCTLIPVSIGDGMTNLSILDAILYSIYQGANVINLSIGNQWTDEMTRWPVSKQVKFSEEMMLTEQEVWDYVFDMANERNVTIVWAAGNSNVYTAMDATKRNANTIKVSALDRKLHKADFSDFGNLEDRGLEMSTISAPGVDILGAMPWSTFNAGPGTSFSAPIVAGAVALMKSLDSSLTNAEIIEILQETGKDVPGTDGKTIGRMIQVRDALMRIKGDMAKSDEVLGDHSKLLGLWQSTRLVEQTTGGVKNGNFDRLYFNITSEKAGEVIIYTATSNKKEYHAPITLSWGKDKLTLIQKEKATCPGEKNWFLPATYICTPDATGLLQVTEKGESYTDKYNIRRVEKIVKE